MLIPAVVYLTLVAWDFQHALDRGFLSNDAVDRRLWLGQAAALVALAVGVSWEWVRGGGPVRRWRGWWSSSRPPRRPAALARSSPTPSTTPRSSCCTRFPTGAASTPAVVPAQPGQDQAVTPSCVAGGQSPCSPIGPASSTTQGWSTRSPPPPASRLRTSGCKHRSAPSWTTSERPRARIVEQGDAERRRLERNLHDGAQQRLVALALSLRLARLGCESETDTAALEQAEAEVRQALGELRGLAHGLYPAALTEEA